MKSSSRWLYIFGAAIGALIIAVVAIVLATGSPSEEPLLGEDTPEGTVQRFLLAVRDEDYQAAESYLATETDDRLDGDILKSRLSGSGEDSGWKATLGDTIIKGDEASVKVRVDVFRPRGPFENSINTHRVTFFLVREDDAWKITSPVNIWWLY